MALRKATLIFNPNAGTLRWRDLIDSLSVQWRQLGWQIAVTPTERAGHATHLARAAAARGEELVFAAGGDGTMHEVANGLAHTETALAPIPVGTANIFAKELGLPMADRVGGAGWTGLLTALADGQVRRMDLGRSQEGRLWLLWAGTGADGFLIDRIEPRTPSVKRWGMIGYATKALWYLPSFSGISGSVTVDARTVEGDFLMVTVSNCRRYAAGELQLNPGGVLDDGKFEVWIFRGKRWPTLLRYAIALGLGSHTRDPNVEMIVGSSVRIETDEPAPYHLDAEPAGSTPLACQVEPDTLRVLVPTSVPAGLFRNPGSPLSR